jgi:hypothetical protein
MRVNAVPSFRRCSSGTQVFCSFAFAREPLRLEYRTLPPSPESTACPAQAPMNGCVLPLEARDIDVEVNEEFLMKHPVINGPSNV